MIELLSPVGDFKCLQAAVQNGANAVYFAAKSFGARAFASNFDDANLEKAINYAKIRNVKTNLTLNTLIKENEFEDAFNIAKKAYEYGIDAIIVQDLGLAKELIKNFPSLPIHASTQMTIHNLEGIKLLEEQGFKRVVLSRELSLEEIQYICKNTNLEIEVFVHGALCVSYSGQCLFSSMIGGRSGNRGKCAQTCRLPFELISKDASGNQSKLDKGYLLSTRDLMGLDYLPKLIKAGVTSFKIEGRMKSPEYVATVTNIYRKYIDLAIDESQKYEIENSDKLKLMQVFNRGGFSNGHLDSKENLNLVYKEKQNNMGLYLGTISKYNKNKGLVTTLLKNNLSIGDSISFENEPTKYTISELLNKGENIKNGLTNMNVTFGRMKGNINLGDKIYKISDKALFLEAQNSFAKEYIKTALKCDLTIKKEEKILACITCKQFNASINFVYDFIPQNAQNTSITKEKIISQFNKTLDTEFYFSDFTIDLSDNLFIPVSVLNDIRRTGIYLIRNKIIQSFKRNSNAFLDKNLGVMCKKNTKPKIALLLNNLNNVKNLKLEPVCKLYIPLKYFINQSYFDTINYLSNNFNLYIYMPTILRKNTIILAKNTIKDAINKFNIKGIVISNLSQLEFLPQHSTHLDIVGNYTLNLYNTYSCKTLNTLNFSTVTISPELDQASLSLLCSNTFNKTELIVYGKTPVMTTNYCVLGRSNKCFKDCKKYCNSDKEFFLKDRMEFLFKVVPDNLQTISTIYNSKTTSIDYSKFNVDFVRIDILDESEDEINNIIETITNGHRIEGKDFTNGNLNREI